MWSRHLPVCRWASNRLSLELRSTSTFVQQRFHSTFEDGGESNRSYHEETSSQKWKLVAVGSLTAAGKHFK